MRQNKYVWYSVKNNRLEIKTEKSNKLGEASKKTVVLLNRSTDNFQGHCQQKSGVKAEVTELGD